MLKQRTTRSIAAMAAIAIGLVTSATTITATPAAAAGCDSPQLLGNPGFESATAPWAATAGVVSSSPSQPARSGSWNAWLDGYGSTHTDTLAQTVALPAGCASYTLSFWLHIDTAERTTTVEYDKLTVAIGSTVLARYSNLTTNSGYVQKTFDMAAFAGQTVTLKFTGTEDYSLQTSFVVDDATVAATSTTPPPPPPPPPPGPTPGTIAVFDRIPQFGIYVWSDPVGYTPPPGVLMWTYGTEYARKLSAAEQAMVGSDVKLRLTYHAQCDNYDRFGSIFYISMPKGQQPTAQTPRVTLQDFITPFSDYWQGSKATRVFPDAPMGRYASALADPTRDVWVGISGGSNPYAEDPCHTSHVVDDAFKAVGFKYSLGLVSSQPLTAGDADVVSILSRSDQTTNQITAPPVSHTAQTGTGTLAVSIAGYGPTYPRGEEYSNTTVTVRVNNQQIASFSTRVDCASYEQYSPDGNPGIFRNNLTTNPRSWCPGALVPTRFFDLTNIANQTVQVSLGLARNVPFTSDSSYRTSLSLIER